MNPKLGGNGDLIYIMIYIYIYRYKKYCDKIFSHIAQANLNTLLQLSAERDSLQLSEDTQTHRSLVVPSTEE